MSNSPTVNSSSYSDGASYGVQEVIAKGWPMPSQNGGKRKHTRRVARAKVAELKRAASLMKLSYPLDYLLYRNAHKASADTSRLNTPNRLDALERTDVLLSVKF